MHVAGEAEPSQRIDKLLAKPPGPREPVKLARRELQILQIGDGLLQPGGHQEAAARRQPADEKLKNRSLCHPPGEVALKHGELIQVGQQCAHYGKSKKEKGKSVKEQEERVARAAFSNQRSGIDFAPAES